MIAIGVTCITTPPRSQGPPKRLSTLSTPRLGRLGAQASDGRLPGAWRASGWGERRGRATLQVVCERVAFSVQSAFEVRSTRFLHASHAA